MLWPDLVLESAAQHCDLAGLQLTWRLLQEGCGSHCPVLDNRVLNAAAESVTPDAVAKMEWVLATAGEGTCSLQESTAAAAARSGDLGRLRWLRDRGCPMCGEDVLLSALERADLAVAQWLVDEAECRLPQPGRAGSAWTTLFLASAGSPDCVHKWEWLRDRGALLLDPSPQQVLPLACVVIQRGRVEGLQRLMLLPQMATAEGREALQQALDQAEGPGCIEVAMHLQQAGCVLTHKAYTKAAEAGDLAMVRWLALEARVPTAGMGLRDLVERWPSDRVARSRDLLQAVQLLVGEAGLQEANIVPAACKAASCGHVPVVQYLLQLLPGYVPGSQVVAAAVVGGCEALVEWLVERPGCRAALSEDLPHYYRIALMGRDRRVLATLRRLGAPWGAEDVVVWAVGSGCEVPVLRWLLEQGAPVGSTRALGRALAKRVKGRSMKPADAKVVYRMASRLRRMAAGGPV